MKKFILASIALVMSVLGSTAWAQVPYSWEGYYVGGNIGWVDQSTRIQNDGHGYGYHRTRGVQLEILSAEVSVSVRAPRA